MADGSDLLTTSGLRVWVSSYVRSGGRLEEALAKLEQLTVDGQPVFSEDADGKAFEVGRIHDIRYFQTYLAYALGTPRKMRQGGSREVEQVRLDDLKDEDGCRGALADLARLELAGAIDSDLARGVRDSIAAILRSFQASAEDIGPQYPTVTVITQASPTKIDD